MLRNSTVFVDYPVLNPGAPLRFLDPQIAMEFELGHYVIVGSMAVMVWDFIISIPEDFRLVRKTKLTFMTGVFLAMRVTAVLSLLYATIVDTAKLQDCARHENIDLILFMVNRTCTSFLFYSRVLAVYRRNHCVLAFFGALWLFVIGSASTLFKVVTGSNVGPTPYCAVEVQKGTLLFLTPAAEAVFDTSLCIAVTYRLVSLRSTPETRHTWKRWLAIDKDQNRSLSDRFLRDSQLYFLLTACIKVPELIMMIALAVGTSSISPIQFVLVYPDLLIVNVLASKIYRNMRLGQPGLLAASSHSTTMPNISHIRIGNGGTSSDEVEMATYPQKSKDEEHRYPPGILYKSSKSTILSDSQNGANTA
ncbi:hypothetical protein CPB83DRAFT_850496 [Crepidotus variabilis]|uniref:DUF6533 domain-containing protein n=1 Tax=Crepidotus variabilis TaxID=179855 RepID=A0A9P6EK43_9AGAR|nr:hypothetical protein CPB83DRAFT_850496 [Crepidotus variabilis]